MDDDILENLIGTVRFVDQRSKQLENKYDSLEARVITLENKVLHSTNSEYLESAADKIGKKYKVTFDQLSKRYLSTTKS